LGPGVWLALSILASQSSTSANCSLVLSLQQDFDHGHVEEVNLLTVKLVIGLMAGVFSQLELLSTEMITWARDRWSCLVRLDDTRWRS